MSNALTSKAASGDSAGIGRSSKPVFVVGMNGSGTTMLLDHLGSHPHLYGFRLETKILPYYLLHQSRYGDLEVEDNFLRLFDEMRGAFPFRKFNNGTPVELPPDWRTIARTPAAIFDHLMGHFANLENKARWCEKSPMHVFHISDLAQAWPDAQFIHVIRDGRNCAASFHRRWGYTPEASIYRWKQCLRAGRRQGALLGGQRYLEIRYEALTGDAESELRTVCHFLQVEYVDAMLESSRSGKRVRGLSSATIRPNDRSFAEYFPESRCDGLERIAGSTLAQFGYDTRYPLADEDPPAVKMRFWLLRDRLRVAASNVLGKLSSNRQYSWSLLIRKLIRDLRHARFKDS